MSLKRRIRLRYARGYEYVSNTLRYVSSTYPSLHPARAAIDPSMPRAIVAEYSKNKKNHHCHKASERPRRRTAGGVPAPRLHCCAPRRRGPSAQSYRQWPIASFMPNEVVRYWLLSFFRRTIHLVSSMFSSLIFLGQTMPNFIDLMDFRVGN